MIEVHLVRVVYHMHIIIETTDKRETKLRKGELILESSEICRIDTFRKQS